MGGRGAGGGGGGGGGGIKIIVITNGGLETFYSGLQGGMNFMWIIYIYPLPWGSRYFLTSPESPTKLIKIVLKKYTIHKRANITG
mgnify:CR=1 FL=1